MSKIEWTGETWNPIVGCSIVSPGCTNCYAMGMAARIEKMMPDLLHYRGLTKTSKAGPVWTGKMALASEKTLLEPLKRRKPTTSSSIQCPTYFTRASPTSGSTACLP